MKKSIDVITVIIPVYNVERYLEECVKSVLEQTYINLEIILVDDGSADRSGELCDDLKDRDKRISVIHKANAGLGYARNSGLDLATGRYITFLDSDDYIEPMMIETLYDSMKKYNVDECKMGFKRVKDDGEITSETKYSIEVFLGEEARTKFAPRLVGSSPEMHDSIEMCVCGALFNGDLIRRYNLRFPSERELISEDLIFQLDYLQHANGACTIESTDYKYRVNDSSLTQSYRTDRIEKSIIFYEDIIKRLYKYGYDYDVETRAQRLLFVYIKVSISQEVLYEKNNMKDAIRNINKICRNPEIQKIIKSYPIAKLGIQQRVFLECIKNKCGIILYLLKKMNVY